jgi:hypothetical protein
VCREDATVLGPGPMRGLVWRIACVADRHREAEHSRGYARRYARRRSEQWSAWTACMLCRALFLLDGCVEECAGGWEDA